MSNSWLLPDAFATERLGESLARPGAWSEHEARVLYLSGELGAGKTTLAAALLRRAGVQGAVRSPSYSLVELYELECGLAVHVDLYRLQTPAELEQLGLRDYLTARTLLLIEWPERAEGRLAAPDLHLHLHVDAPRRATIAACSEAGRHWLAQAGHAGLPRGHVTHT